jgi:hypothetical protein
MTQKIAVKLSPGVFTPVKTPFIKLGDNNWYKAKRVMVKVDASTWKEVWPGAQIYTHVGYGYNMNIAACFGYPQSPSNFIFINNGKIGGTPGNFALRTGGFPAGSTLTIINNGYIEGAGGKGGNVTRTGTPHEPDRGTH